MYVNTRKQIPVSTKIVRGCEIILPVDIRRALGWNTGDNIEIFGTMDGIFIRKKEEETNEKTIKV